MKLTINFFYLKLAIVFFLIEVFIVIFFKQGFIRHTLGDYLVIPLLFFALKTFLNISDKKLITLVLIIAYTIESLQLTSVKTDNYWLQLILGSTFSISDLLAYTLAAITLIIIKPYYEKITKQTQ